METICILDTETTGLNPDEGKLLEVAAILFHIPSRSIICQASTLFPANSNEAYEINRIELSALQYIPYALNEMATSLITNILYISDAIVCHNAEFDKKWMNTIPEFQPYVKDKKWICTRNDVVWPIRKGIPLNLIHICADLGVPIVDTHRALSDCHLLLNALGCIEDIEYFLDKSGKGRITYYASAGYEQRQIVKDAGFMWDNIKKVWHAKITREEAAILPFTVFPAESPCENK